MSTTIPEVTLNQLSTHATLSSLWIAVHGNVYDLTTFISDHPGGTDVLQASAGTDGTEAYDYAGHSVLNTKNLQQFLVGRLEGASSPSANPTSLASAATKWKIQDTASGVIVSKIFLGLGVTLVVIAYALWGGQGVVAHLMKVEEVVKGGGKWGGAHAFWIGVAVMSALGLLVGAWSWRLFRSTLEYETKFPATIPRRRKN